MKKMLNDALELIWELETRPEAWIATTEGLSIMVAHLFIVFDIEEPWQCAGMLSGTLGCDNGKLGEPISPQEIRFTMNQVKKFLVGQGRLEVDPTPDDPDAYKVRLPFGLSS